MVAHMIQDKEFWRIVHPECSLSCLQCRFFLNCRLAETLCVLELSVNKSPIAASLAVIHTVYMKIKEQHLFFFTCRVELIPVLQMWYSFSCASPNHETINY